MFSLDQDWDLGWDLGCTPLTPLSVTSHWYLLGTAIGIDIGIGVRQCNHAITLIREINLINTCLFCFMVKSGTQKRVQSVKSIQINPTLFIENKLMILVFSAFVKWRSSVRGSQCYHQPVPHGTGVPRPGSQPVVTTHGRSSSTPALCLTGEEIPHNRT